MVVLRHQQKRGMGRRRKRGGGCGLTTSIALAVSLANDTRFAAVVVHASDISSSPRGKGNDIHNIDRASVEAQPTDGIYIDNKDTRNSLRRTTTETELSTLTTTYDGVYTASGIMFNIKATSNPITIKGMNINTRKANAQTRILIYTKVGSYKGFEMNETSWQLYMNNTVSSNGVGNPTYISSDIFEPMSIPKDEMYSFYITSTDGANIRYSSYSNSYSAFSNDDLTLYSGAAKHGHGFLGAYISPRVFNGAIHYELVNEEEEQSQPNVPIGFSWVNNWQSTESEIASQAPTNHPTTNQPTKQPSTSPVTSRPSQRPTRRPVTSLPSQRPTLRPVITPRPSQRPTSKPVSSISKTITTQESFRLRLYWSPDKPHWQDTPSEMFWCIECEKECTKDDKIVIDWCGRSVYQKFHNFAYDQSIRPDVDSNLCFTVTGYGEEELPIVLQECNGSAEQKFLDVPVPDSGRFKLRPKYRSSYCLTQQHHPKAWERVYPEECDRAIKDGTGYWIKF